MNNRIVILFFSFFLIICQAEAQIADNNGDGVTNLAAFGDSLTYGIGADGLDPKDSSAKSYPAYLSGLLGLEVANKGVPGEVLIPDGSERALGIIKTGTYDYLIVMEGINDAVHQVSTSEISIYLQEIINVALINRMEPVLLTLPDPAGDHAGIAIWANAYNQVIAQLAYINDLKLVDLEVIWSEHGCTAESCDLYNMPEGLHPNSTGYQLIAESVYNVLMGVKNEK